MTLFGIPLRPGKSATCTVCRDGVAEEQVAYCTECGRPYCYKRPAGRGSLTSHGGLIHEGQIDPLCYRCDPAVPPELVSEIQKHHKNNRELESKIRGRIRNAVRRG